MNSSKSNSHQQSPSFPSGELMSDDIFFQVKKQILDRLDIILQKVNLKVIEYLKPENQKRQNQKNQQKIAFKFIELSSFEKQIQSLFDYLDRLYSSLNSSVSFSTNQLKNTNSGINAQLQSNRSSSVGNKYNTQISEEINLLKQKCLDFSQENFRLRQENQHMRFMLKNNTSHSHSHSLTQSFNQQSKSSLKAKNDFQKNKQTYNQKIPNQSNQSVVSNQSIKKQQNPQQLQGISLDTVKKILRFYNHSIRQLSVEYKESTKQIKKLLKQAKFQIVQSRVQCIAQLKKWSQKLEFYQLERNQNQLEQYKIKNKENGKLMESIQKSREQNCGQQCYKLSYEKTSDQNCFQEDILKTIQQILDVC